MVRTILLAREMIVTILARVVLVLTVAGVGPAVLADSANYDYAEVVSALPVVETYQHEVPREECWTERQQLVDSGNSITPEIVGAIVGGAVGYQFGSGRGQDIATVAGAVLGGSVGHDIKLKNARQSGAYQQVQRCRLVSDYNTEERIVAYDVAYRYNGQLYRTSMDYDPGERVRVAISVDVVE